MQNFKATGSFRDKRRRFVHYSAQSGECAKVEIAYRDGGMSFADYKNRPRGIYLAVKVVQLSRNEAGTATMEQYSPMADCNFTFHLEDAKRYNDRRIEAVAEAWDEFVGEFAALYMTDREAAVAKLREFIGEKQAA